MAELKTKKNDGDVLAFLNNVENKRRREDGLTILDLMKKVTGEEPSMWGDSIVGFGSYHYKQRSGQEADWFRMGFSPRKQNMTLYIMDGFSDYETLLGQLGKHKTGVSCLYINKLADVDEEVLIKLMEASWGLMQNEENIQY